METEQQENRQFTERKTMEKEFNAEVAAKGYGIVTKCSYKQRDGRQVVHYKCDRLCYSAPTLLYISLLSHQKKCEVQNVKFKMRSSKCEVQ